MNIHILQVPPIGTNCYLVLDENTNKGAIVDPGGAAKGIISAIQELNMIPEAIFLTHGHYDHTGAVQELREEYPDISVYLHPLDAERTKDPTGLMPPIGTTLPYDEGDEITVGEMTFRVLHTPGHSAGSVTLDSGEALFTGDTMFAGNCGRTDLAGGDPEKMAESLKRLALLEGDRQVLPGHEDTSTLARERVSNYWVQFAMNR